MQDRLVFIVNIGMAHKGQSLRLVFTGGMPQVFSQTRIDLGHVRQMLQCLIVGVELPIGGRSQTLVATHDGRKGCRFGPA